VLAVDPRSTNHRIDLASPKHIHRHLAAQVIIGSHQEGEPHPRVHIFVKCGQDLSKAANYATIDKLTGRVLVPTATSWDSEKRAGHSPFADGLAAHSKQDRDLSRWQRSPGSPEQVSRVISVKPDFDSIALRSTPRSVDSATAF